MARDDQYIGLNVKAQNFLEKIKNQLIYEEYPHILVPVGQTLCYGGDISGIYIRVFKPGDIVNEYLDIIEELQYTPHSSGPMYFTHLRFLLKKRVGQVLDMGVYFSWMHDGTNVLKRELLNNETHREFDTERAEIYI